LSEIFLNLRRIQWDVVINVQTSLCKIPVIIVRFLVLLGRVSKKRSNIKFHEIPSSGSQVVPRERADRYDEPSSKVNQSHYRPGVAQRVPGS